MKKLIASAFAVVLVCSFVRADVGAYQPAAKELTKIVEEGPYVETSQKGITLSGYVDAGYIYNFSGSGYNRDGGRSMVRVSQDESPRGDFNLNAAKLVLEKPLTDANELQAGFRADLMMGEDANVWGQDAAGSDSLFMEQAYVQFRLPYANGFDFKVGKMASILGYEVVERPANLNITYGNIMTTIVPTWHTGALMSYRFNDMFDMQLGVVNGANVDNGIGANDADNGAVVASLNFTAPGGNYNWYHSVMYGVNGDGNARMDESPYITYDTWMNWVPKFANDKLLLGANFVIANGTNASANGWTAGLSGSPTEAATSTAVGWALYTKYQFTDMFSLAHRLDYIHNDDSLWFGNDPTLAAANDTAREDIWSYTLTAGFDIIENMMLRAEYRVDFGDDLYRGDGLAQNNMVLGNHMMHTAAVQVVYSF